MTASVQHSSRLWIFNILRSLFKNMKIFPTIVVIAIWLKFFRQVVVIAIWLIFSEYLIFCNLFQESLGE